MKKHVLASMVAAATISVLTPLTSHAFGLGKINVMSALNEPFKAEIDVTALKPEEKDNLQVKMASQSEFDKAGLNRSLLVNQMQFDIVERGGQHKILITSKQSIREPFLDFLVTATAGAGIMLREYTVLLDPPEYILAETRPASARPAPTKQAASAETTTSPSTTRYQYADSSSSGFTGSSYKVKRSDTLWNVALQTRPASDLTVHQMMLALLKRNPSAFTNENVNGLKAGVTLQIPSRNEVEAMSHAAARQAFAEQNQAWKNRNQTAVTQVVEAAPESVSPEPVPSSADVDEAATEATETTAAVQTAETSTGAPEARLQLLAPEDEVSEQQEALPNVQGNKQLQTLTEQLTFAQETIEAQAQENVDLQQRMALLEEQIETMRRMISLEDPDLARMQAMLEDESETAAVAPVDSSEQSEVAAESVFPADAETTPELSESEQTADDTSSTVTAEADEAASEATDDVTPAADDVDSVVTKAAQALNVDETQVRSTIDSVKTFIADNKIPTALGLLLLLLILWLIARRSNREVTWDEAVKNLDKADGKQAATAVVAPQISEDLSVSSFSDDQAADDKTAAELIEQADMFVGYADYVQAKSSLEQARVMEPANSLVAYKTLFVLYKLNQSDEFVELAEQTEFESDSLEWSEISEWGRELAPEHALFMEQTQVADMQDEVFDTADLDFNDAAEASDLESGNTDDEFELNLDLDADAAEKAADAEEADTGHIEFDLDDFTASKTVDEDEVSAALSEEDSEQTQTQEVDDDLLSFDTNFTSVEPDSDESLNIDINNSDEFDSTVSFDTELESVAEEDNFELDAVDISAGNDTADLEFDIGDLDDIDEAETKLDLAAAYVDMGDPDGARSILNEVLDEGSDEQKQRANDLLSSLG